MDNDPVNNPDETDESKEHRPERSIPNQQPVNGEAGARTPTPLPNPRWPTPIPTPPEVMEWMRNIPEEEIIAGLHEIQETGGLELSDFIDELERMAGLNE
jgi:hypothetical protein